MIRIGNFKQLIFEEAFQILPIYQKLLENEWQIPSSINIVANVERWGCFKRIVKSYSQTFSSWQQ